jgi:hypothetical protein
MAVVAITTRTTAITTTRKAVDSITSKSPITTRARNTLGLVSALRPALFAVASFLAATISPRPCTTVTASPATHPMSATVPMAAAAAVFVTASA